MFEVKCPKCNILMHLYNENLQYYAFECSCKLSVGFSKENLKIYSFIINKENYSSDGFLVSNKYFIEGKIYKIDVNISSLEEAYKAYIKLKDNIIFI